VSGDATATAAAVLAVADAGAAAEPAAGAAKPAEGAKPDPAKPGAAPTTPAVEAPKKASDYARLAAQTKGAESKIKAERAQLESDRKAWEAEKGEALKNASASELARFRERIKAGEFDEALAELGVDYAAWSKARLAKMGKGAPAKQAEQDVGKLVNAEIERREKLAAETAKTNEEKAWADSWAPLAKEIAAKPEGFELLGEQYAEDATYTESIFREIARRQPGITAHEAATKIEAYLLDKQKRFAQIPKVKALLGAPETKPNETSNPGAEAGQKAGAGGPRTLTNADAAEPSGNSGSDPNRPLSRPERIALEREEEARRDRAALDRMT
jgi:hypothetical protein